VAGYRVLKQREGTRVSFWPDPRGPGHGRVRVGTVMQHQGDLLLIVWDDDDDHYEHWPSPEVRYRIDRGQMNLKPPPKEGRRRIPKNELLCKQCGKPRELNCKCPRPGAMKPEEWGAGTLTASSQSDRMTSSINAAHDDDRMKGATMARKTMTKVDPPEELDDELEELEELGTVEEPTTKTASDEEDGDMLTAKGAATAIGTDARTLRKFLRKQQGTIGQGKRWAISAEDIPKLKKDFEAYSKGKPAAEGAAKVTKATTAAPEPDEAEINDELDDELDGFEDLD